MKIRIAATIMALCFANRLGAQTVTIGDRDCFGGAGGPGPGPCVSFPEPSTFPADFRSAAEKAASNGAQQTDFYSALFDPLPESMTLLFPTVGLVTSATFSYRSYGLEAAAAFPFSSTVNGVARDLFNFQDGPEAIAVHNIVLGPADIASINANGGMTVVAVSRDDSFDAVMFDYFELTYTTAGIPSVVPEPSTYALMMAGLLGLGAAARRRRTAA